MLAMKKLVQYILVKYVRAVGRSPKLAAIAAV
jgi:hypothetical protein